MNNCFREKILKQKYLKSDIINLQSHVPTQSGQNLCIMRVKRKTGFNGASFSGLICNYQGITFDFEGKIIMKTILLAILSMLLFSSARAAEKQEILELKSRYGFKVMRRQPVNFNIFADFDSGGNKTKLFASVSLLNDVLQFEKISDTYNARFRISISMRSDSSTILQFSRKHTISFKDFKRTNSKTESQIFTYCLNNSSDSLKITAGKYTFLLDVEDLITKNAVQKKRILELPSDFLKRQSTDICFLQHLPDSSRVLPLAPYSTYLDYNAPYTVYARIKTDSSSIDSIHIRLFRDQQLFLQQAQKINSAAAVTAVYYSLPKDTLSEGDYRIEFQYGKQVLKKNFSIVWFRKPSYLYKYDLALRPMRYLLSEEEYDKADDLDEEQLSVWFKAFWKKRDPSPGTQFNELLDEFYARVSESNYKFRTRVQEGWETDRGRIFILYGPPPKVENGRYAIRSLPWLIWEYGDSLKFIFVDKKRNGEFILTETVQKD